MTRSQPSPEQLDAFRRAKATVDHALELRRQARDAEQSPSGAPLPVGDGSEQ